MKPTLFILAAGMGSRYGGLKQLDTLGPSGETIMDYSVYDALQAGFGKIVFVIRKDFEDEFRAKVASKYEGHVPVEIVFQSPDALPEGFTVPEGRTKPWGTGHAVLMGKDAIREPFAVINADDFYGRESFRALADFLKDARDEDHCYCMIGFHIANTLSENGTVSRGLCHVDSDGYLKDVRECHGIGYENGELLYDGPEGKRVPFPSDGVVSMNMWGFTPSYFVRTEKDFADFLSVSGRELKSEFYIPTVVNNMLASGEVKLKVIPCKSKWFGVTYAADRQATVDQFARLVREGVYPSPLFK